MTQVTNNQGTVLSLQAESAFSVTPNDSTDITQCTLFIGTGGDVKVNMYGIGTAIIFKNVPDGVSLPIIVERVYATDTTASDIIGMY